MTYVVGAYTTRKRYPTVNSLALAAMRLSKWCASSQFFSPPDESRSRREIPNSQLASDVTPSGPYRVSRVTETPPAYSLFVYPMDLFLYRKPVRSLRYTVLFIHDGGSWRDLRVLEAAVTELRGVTSLVAANDLDVGDFTLK